MLRVCCAMVLLIGSLLGTQARAAESAAMAPLARPEFSVQLPAGLVDIVGLLGPPPPAASAAQQADLDAVLAAQRQARAAGTTGRAVADAAMRCTRFDDVLGPQLNSPGAREPLQVIQAAALSVSSIVQPAKLYWKRPRPFVVSREVEALADVSPAPNAGNAVQLRNNTSYPSGHATFGMACGLLLALAVPEKRAELIARGRQYGDSRLVVGAHFPTDVAAGQVAATLGVALAMQNAGFQRQFYAAVPLLRAALGLPAQLPDLEPNRDLFSLSPPALAAPAR